MAKKLSGVTAVIIILAMLLSACAKPLIVGTPMLTPTTTEAPPVPTVTTTALPRVFLPVQGLYVQFEQRGSPSRYWSGQVITHFYTDDPVVGHTVGEEIANQLDIMKEMGVNTIAFELRSSAEKYIPGPFAPPDCNISPALGIQYPQPTPEEITHLKAFLDLLNSKGMKVHLRLVNTHMAEAPTANNELWLGTILNAIKDHPALDLVLFEGSVFMYDSDGDGVKDKCGGPAEPGLWEGPTMVPARYVKWAIGYAHSLGMPYRNLSAQAIVGNYYTIMQAPNGFMTDGHHWEPIEVLKGIFDELAVPENQRTYAISFYEHRKCSTANELPCEDLNPHAWALETVTKLFDTIGRGTGARVVAVEMGLLPPAELGWTTEMALQSLVWIMKAYDIEGGDFWRWTSFSSDEDLNKTLSIPVKLRGVDYIYTPVKNMLENLYVMGQTDDLALTPDSTAPVFAFKIVSPATVKNGDTLELTAALGETHLFVSADISRVDSNQVNPVTLIDMGNGTYKASAPILLWNSVGNGMKQVTLKAMDFWSNTATTTVAVELKNSAATVDTSTYNDSFDGTVLDTANWKRDLSGGGGVTQDGQLMMTTSDMEAYSSARVESAWALKGDFDIQVDFEIGEGWKSPEVEHIDGAFLGVKVSGQSYHITRIRSQYSDNLFAWSSDNLFIGVIPTEAVTGKLRLLRSGNMLVALYDVGGGWQKLASVNVTRPTAVVYFGNGSVGSSMEFRTDFDNFQVNAGSIAK